MYFCFWTRTEVSFDPILPYFQESTGDWICKVHCMLYNETFYTGFIRRFSTSPAKNCFVNFFYCRYVRGLNFLDWNGTPWLSGLHCIALIALRVGRRLHTDLSSKGGVKILPGIALRDQWRCTVLISPSIVCGRAYFWRGTIVNGQIVVCSFWFDRISSVEDILLDVFGWSMLHRASHDTQRAQTTLRLHSSRFIVESCDVFVGNRTLFEQFGNISTSCRGLRTEWKLLILSGSLFGISSRLESSLQFRQKPLLGFVTFNSIWTEWSTIGFGSSPSERNRVCVEALLVVWVIWAREHGKFDSRLFTCGKAFG